MIFKIITSSLLIPSLGCSSNREFSSSSKYETVFSRTINKEQFKLIYQILEENLSDFPSKKKNKISYKKVNDKYSLDILLKKKSFRLAYKSNSGYDKKIDFIKSEIVLIK